MIWKFILSVIVLTSVATTIVLGDDEQQEQQPQPQPQQNNSSSPIGIRALMRIYDDCQRADGGFSMCLKKKAVTFIDRVSKIETINLGDGVKVVGLDNDIKVPKTLSENDLDQMLPRGLEDRDYFLTNMLTEKIASYISGRNIQISLPQISSADIGRGMEEGRGKMKKMMSMMMMGFAMKMAALVPVAIAGLYLLAGKALIVSKIALLLAGIIGIKKLLQGKNAGQSSGWSSGSGGGGGGGGWQATGHSSGGGGSGGWDRRSNDAAQNLAYKGYYNN